MDLAKRLAEARAGIAALAARWPALDRDEVESLAAARLLRDAATVPARAASGAVADYARGATRRSLAHGRLRLCCSVYAPAQMEPAARVELAEAVDQAARTLQTIADGLSPSRRERVERWELLFGERFR